MDDWLKEEIDAAKKRKERKERKLARRELDREVIASGKEEFWSALVAALQSAIERFNNAGVSDPITITVKGFDVWIRTPGYPAMQILLEFRDGMNDILVSTMRQETTIDPGHPFKSQLKFDVNDDGHLMLRDNGSLMDVSQTVRYLMSGLLPIINSDR